ncbi:hypothetical protein B0I35DRAFT_355419 [Stachybotrys elegans]|uniref:Mcm2 3 5 family protein n=1 Tax=Stachybotrys elegans TaxID=80388 RepID=A0A8K0SP51_9HYPO|nr:hypothetical protein B0I35DRAFT_355419 [Stachybotrys elegans]
MSPHFLSRPAYHRVNSDSYLPDDGLDNSSPFFHRTSFTRVPVGARGGSGASTPRSYNPGSPFLKSPGWTRTPTIPEFERYDIRPSASEGGISGEPSPAFNKAEVNRQDPINDDDDDYDDELFHNKFGQPPSYCWSKEDIHVRRFSWFPLITFFLSVYSTILSGLWLVVAIIQPSWGHRISTRQGLEPASASLIAALVAKTIEISFVTVFVAWLGQVLTRRAFRRQTEGMTVAEMTMRNWVLQPGSLLIHSGNLRYAGLTFLGVLTLTATVASAFYTTASEAMVAPKVKSGGWVHKELSGLAYTSYANVTYISRDCANGIVEGDGESSGSCLSVQFAGQSYRNLISFMTGWERLIENGTQIPADLTGRPTGTMLLFDNTTMTSSWIETAYGNVAQQHDSNGRIINNVTLAMPHPGVYAAATDPTNGILQPDDLAGIGRYSVRAGVVSPSVNVMCVNMDRDELAPLVYTEWPYSSTEPTHVGDQRIGTEDWLEHVPPNVDEDGNLYYYNRTEVDDIFRWGEDYTRQPPVFQLFPSDYNLLTNSTVAGSDAIYMLAKSPHIEQYTLCELRSWVSPNCSTHFTISGTTGASMFAHCEDPNDQDSYRRSFDPEPEWAPPAMDWRQVALSWALSMDLNGGAYNNNASNARIITQLALGEAELPADRPSIAEALAVFASSTIVLGSIDTPFVHYWSHTETQLRNPDRQMFNASLITQQYTSGHVEDWHVVFYAVLGPVFAINLFCLIYFILRSGLVTDFTEPQNLFALAINSPPSAQIKGSCGGGPTKRDLVVPWRVAYAPSANHYFFEEANEKPWRGRYSEIGVEHSTGADAGPLKSSYRRLSKSTGWLDWGRNRTTAQ